MEMADTTSIDQDVAAALNRVIFARLLRVEPDPWQEKTSCVQILSE